MGRITQEAIEVPSLPAGEEETPTSETPLASASGSTGEEDAMVSEAIGPFSIKSWIVVAETGA